MSDFDIRELATDDDRRAAADAVRAALLAGPISDELHEKARPTWNGGRFLGAWDADRCVGHVGAFDFETTVSGGAALPTSGVTRVGVLPTHTRRGLLTAMMHQLLAEERAAGKALATLWASETAIYGRFGFGLGNHAHSVEVDARLARPMRIQPTGSMRLLSVGEVDEVVPALYDRVATRRVAAFGRPEWMWTRVLADARTPPASDLDKGVYVAVHTGVDGVDDGFVLYDIGWRDEFGEEFSGAGTIRELWGATAEVEAQLWRFVLDLDLVTMWRVGRRPTDEAIGRTFGDTRAYRVRKRYDEMWVRLLDVGAALTARTYGPASDPVALAVSDPLFADNDGTWRIAADGAAPTDDRPDLAVDIATVSSAYFGSVSWSELRDAGEIDAATPDRIVTLLDALFAQRPAPFCGSEF